MKLKLVSDERKHFLCDRYEISEVESTDDVLATYRRLLRDNAGFAFLFTLDDFYQACYTSCHSLESHNLDCTDGHDLSGLPLSCFEDTERRQHIGPLTTKEEFSIRRANLLKGCQATTLDDVFSKDLQILDEEAQTEFIDANEDILSVMDEPACVLKVPGDNSYDSLAAFPNGYFTCDLNPYENYLLAKHLETEYGYQLFGMGASYLAFCRSRPLDPSAQNKLTTELVTLYCDAPDSEFALALTGFVANQEFLALKYTE